MNEKTPPPPPMDVSGINEDDLLKTTEDTLKEASEQGIIIDMDTKISGIRELGNRHKTTYIIYNGTDNSKEPTELIKIVGESWNCGGSGTSIICIGISQITDNANNNTIIDTTFWEKIISDNTGLIFNVKCH